MKRFLVPLIMALLLAPLVNVAPAAADNASNPVDPACGTYAYGHRILWATNWQSSGLATAITDPKDTCYIDSSLAGSVCARIWISGGSAGTLDCHTMASAGDFAISQLSGTGAYSFHRICGPYGSCSDYWL